MKQIEVSILGHSYILGCPEGGEPQLLAAVSKVARALAKRQVFKNTTTSPSSDEPSNENMAQLIHRIDLILSQPC